VYQDYDLVENITSEIHYSGASWRLSTAQTVFDLTPGNYTLVITQRVLRVDGSPTPFYRRVHLVFSQLQDLSWIEISIQWDQLQLALLVVGISLFLLGIYVTNHNYDTPEEYERYQRKKNGERNYPYDWRYRRKMKQRR
jgi:hypothetical protein